MNRNIYILISILSFYSCNRIAEEDAVTYRNMCESIRTSNNQKLVILKEDLTLFPQLKKIHDDDKELYLSHKKNIDELIELNQSNFFNVSNLTEFLIKYNLNNFDRCHVDLELNGERAFDCGYYLLALEQIINQACLSMGTIHEPIVFLNYSINNPKFTVKRGKILNVPIKTFPNKNTGEYHFKMFDTLNYTQLSNNTGIFKVTTEGKKNGTYKQEFPVYAKNILDRSTEIVGRIEIEYEIK